jgi:hypothetical protein
MGDVAMPVGQVQAQNPIIIKPAMTSATNLNHWLKSQALNVRSVGWVEARNPTPAKLAWIALGFASSTQPTS